MKLSHKALALFLAVIMLVSCMGISALADSTATVKQYGAEGGYIALGDSIARGVGATGDNDAETHNFYDRTVDGSYPYLVAQAVGCSIKDDARDSDSNFYPVCFHGQTLAITMDLLGIDDGYYDDVYAHGTGKDAYHYYPIMEELYGNARQYLCDAGLVTIGFGLSDVFYRAIVIAQMNGTEINAEFVETVVANIYEGYEYWVKAYPMLLDFIKENNPDATVVLVGNYNVGGDTPLSSELLLPVGIAASAVTGYMDSYLKQWAGEYGYLYCDISNAETLASQEDVGLLDVDADNLSLLGHLSPEGNALVARSILNMLPLQEGKKQVTTDVVVDLGRFTSVSLVMLDGKVLSSNEYYMDGTVLTIPYKLKSADNLTIAADSGGKASVYTYQLSYSDDAGYSARLIYGVDNVANLVKNATAKLVYLMRSVLSIFN